MSEPTTIYIPADDERIGETGNRQRRPKVDVFSNPHTGDILNRAMLGEGRYVILPNNLKGQQVKVVIGSEPTDPLAMRLNTATPDETYLAPGRKSKVTDSDAD